MNIKEFKNFIWDFYAKNKRDLPWRNTHDPYSIVVSEVMLQQTQVNRVLTKYPLFLYQFPTFNSLAKASTTDVLTAWSGMGYNRRALYLQKIAQKVMNEYGGVLPRDTKILETFPGIGYATAHSIVTFAYNYPGIFIETNIRRVFIHCFFSDKETVNDKEILPLVMESVDRNNPREWYYALMDYGSVLPKQVVNPNRKSKYYAIQSAFEGSNRQMRGAILRELLNNKQLSEEALLQKFPEDTRVKPTLLALEKEGFIIKKDKNYFIK